MNLRPQVPVKRDSRYHIPPQQTYELPRDADELSLHSHEAPFPSNFPDHTLILPNQYPPPGIVSSRAPHGMNVRLREQTPHTYSQLPQTLPAYNQTYSQRLATSYLPNPERTPQLGQSQHISGTQRAYHHQEYFENTQSQHNNQYRLRSISDNNTREYNYNSSLQTVRLFWRKEFETNVSNIVYIDNSGDSLIMNIPPEQPDCYEAEIKLTVGEHFGQLNILGHELFETHEYSVEQTRAQQNILLYLKSPPRTPRYSFPTQRSQSQLPSSEHNLTQPGAGQANETILHLQRQRDTIQKDYEQLRLRMADLSNLLNAEINSLKRENQQLKQESTKLDEALISKTLEISSLESKIDGLKQVLHSSHLKVQELTDLNLEMVNANVNILADRNPIPEAPLPLNQEIVQKEVPLPLNQIIVQKELPLPLNQEIVQKELPLPLNQEIVQKELPLPLNQEIVQKELPLPLNQEIVQKELALPLNLEIVQKEVPLPLNQEIVQKELALPLNLEIVQKEVPLPLNQEIVQKELPLPLNQEIVQKELPLPLNQGIVQKELPLPLNQGIVQKELPLPLNQEIVQKELPLPLNQGIVQKELPLPLNQEIVQEVPLPLKGEIQKEIRIPLSEEINTNKIKLPDAKWTDNNKDKSTPVRKPKPPVQLTNVNQLKPEFSGFKVKIKDVETTLCKITTCNYARPGDFIGQLVFCRPTNRDYHSGILRVIFITKVYSNTMHRNTEYAGIEFNDKVGNSDGFYKGDKQQHFNAEAGYAAFLPLTDISVQFKAPVKHIF